MVTALTVTKKEKGIGEVTTDPPVAWQATSSSAVITIDLEASNAFDEFAEKRAWLAMTESALAEGWDDSAQ